MNNIFDIKRFGLVFRKDFLENFKRYALLFLTMLGIMAIVIILMSWNYFNKLEESNHSNILIHNKSLLTFMSFVFFACGVLFASTLMTPMNSKLKRLSYLISPSSNFEKFFSRWIIVTIGYILAFFVAMWMADALRVAVITARYPDLEIKFMDLTKLIYPRGDYTAYREGVMPKDVFTISLFVYFFSQSLYILGSTFWEKSSFIKTFVAVLIINIVFINICRLTMILFYEEGTSGFINVLNSFFSNNEVMEKPPLFLLYTALSVFTLANWVLAFFRFRESEIIKRF